MVGLSVVLEGQKAKSGTSSGGVSNKTTMVVNNINIHSSGGSKAFSPSALSFYPRYFTQPPYLQPYLQTNFLDKCFLCNKKLLLHKDIYMYKGDNGFCSVECRYQQIMLDEDESIRKEMQCSMATMKPTSASASSSSSSSASSSKDSNRSKGARNRASGFAY